MRTLASELGGLLRGGGRNITVKRHVMQPTGVKTVSCGTDGLSCAHLPPPR